MKAINTTLKHLAEGDRFAFDYAPTVEYVVSQKGTIESYCVKVNNHFSGSVYHHDAKVIKFEPEESEEVTHENAETVEGFMVVGDWLDPRP